MKIPFTLDAWLKDKSQKIETRSGENVRIICWDKKGVPIFAIVGDADDIVTYNRDGQQMQLPSDLFIVTPEEELTEFENAFGRAMMEVPDPEEKEEWYPFLKEKASELLALAREQFINDGYVIEKKAFHDAVEKVATEVMKEVSDKVDMEEALRLVYEKGKADALKDLPRWKKLPNGIMKQVKLMKDAIIINNHYIRYSDIEKLPGFKEDEK